MQSRSKILLLDDDQDFLVLYKEMLSRHLPSQPEIKIANSGNRALAILESESINLLILDLGLPKMDGLQVITIIRRKYPQLKVVVLTAIRDEQFRTRAYSMGVDQYWLKPETDQEIALFMESIDSLICHEVQQGFRGVQSKSLVDIIQLECLAQASCTLRITNGQAEGKIFLQNGEVVDALVPGLNGEPAFQRILKWKTGSFETMPPDPTRTRTIFSSYQGLLLNTAQALDEAAVEPSPTAIDDRDQNKENRSLIIDEITQVEGVEFMIASTADEQVGLSSWGLDDPSSIAGFTKETVYKLQRLGEQLQVGGLQQVLGTGPHRKIALASNGLSNLCVGFSPSTAIEQVRSSFKSILSKWAS